MCDAREMSEKECSIFDVESRLIPILAEMEME
jgi:hypothetical protein